MVRAAIEKLWTKKEIPEISITDNGLYLFRFKDMTARDFFFWISKNLFPKGQNPTNIHTKTKRPKKKNEKRTAPPLNQRKRATARYKNKPDKIPTYGHNNHKYQSNNKTHVRAKPTKQPSINPTARGKQPTSTQH